MVPLQYFLQPNLKPKLAAKNVHRSHRIIMAANARIFGVMKKLVLNLFGGTRVFK